MRLPEQKFWDDLRETMRGQWFARRVEDRLGAGLPDLLFALRKRRSAWMELKVLPKLPAERRVFDIEHFTADQRGFGLSMRDNGGVNSWWLMTRMGDVDHLHNASIIDHIGEINYKLFRNKAKWVGRLSPDHAESIADVLSR